MTTGVCLCVCLRVGGGRGRRGRVHPFIRPLSACRRSSKVSPDWGAGARRFLHLALFPSIAAILTRVCSSTCSLISLWRWGCGLERWDAGTPSASAPLKGRRRIDAWGTTLARGCVCMCNASEQACSRRICRRLTSTRLLHVRGTCEADVTLDGTAAMLDRRIR